MAIAACPGWRERDARIAEWERRVAELEARVRDLTARLGTNSANSSVPPSANPLHAPQTRSEETDRTPTRWPARTSAALEAAAAARAGQGSHPLPAEPLPPVSGSAAGRTRPPRPAIRPRRGSRSPNCRPSRPRSPNIKATPRPVSAVAPSPRRRSRRPSARTAVARASRPPSLISPAATSCPNAPPRRSVQMSSPSPSPWAPSPRWSGR